MKKKLSFSTNKDRFVVLIDTLPAIDNIDGLVMLRTRHGRSLNAAAFPTVDRAARFVVNLDTQLRRIKKVDDSEVRVLRYHLCVVDRVTGLVLTRPTLEAVTTNQMPVRSGPSGLERYSLPDDDAFAFNVSQSVPMYQRFLAAVRLPVILQPVLLRGEDPLATLTLNNVYFDEVDRVNAVRVGGGERYELFEWSGGKYTDVYGIGPNMLPRLKSELPLLFSRVKAAAANLRHELLQDAAQRLESTPSMSQGIKSYEAYSREIENIVTVDNEVFRNIVFPSILNRGADFTDPEVIRNVIMEEIVKHIRKPDLLEQAYALQDQLLPMYVSRDLLNGADLIKWLKNQNVQADLLDPNDMHVTLLYSKQPVEWSNFDLDSRGLTVNEGVRKLELFGKEKDCLVLEFSSSYLVERNSVFLANGGSSDWLGYHSHVTLCYAVPPELDISKIAPYAGPLVFGPEKAAPIIKDWSAKK